MKLLSLLCLGYIVSIINGEIPPTENYPHMSVLDEAGKVKLYWVVNNNQAVFEIHGNTIGWVGMGISPGKDMIGADIVVGWVKNGSAVITDRHGTNNTFPPKDPQQNVKLLEGMQNDGWTLIKFQRQLAASEPGYDLPIKNGSLNIIYAFGDKNPSGNDITSSDYHENNRRVKSLVILTNNTETEATTSHPVVEETSTASNSIEDGLQPTENFTHSIIMDNAKNVMLYWKFNETYITFEIHANTTGWVGMGISPNGGMNGADIVVGWVKSGKAYITDRYGTGNTYPPKDPEQNIDLLDGIEKNGWTLIKFCRELAACEPGYDLPITTDTLKIIYAFGKTDPKGDDITSNDYHGSQNRGVKSMMLLNVGLSDNKKFPEGETHSTFDLLNDNFEVPAEETYYNCRLMKMPELSQKNHVVKIDPVIQPGHELLLHHMIVYACLSGVNETEVGKDYLCFGSDMPPNFSQCNSALHAWAIGVTDFYFPSHAGYPLGDVDSPKYIMLETHYDNPGRIGGMVDSSGLRFTYTSQLRTYDTGIMNVGHSVTGMQHIIPPNAESFYSYGECTNNCLKQTMLQDNVEGINVFSVNLHTHLIGVGVKIRHIRNEIELPYLAKDDSYDFNYQETRTLPEERVIKPTDSLQVVCNYRSKGVRSKFTLGGYESKEEMCIGFIYYYPKLSTSVCGTTPTANELMNYFGITKTTSPPEYSRYDDLSMIDILEPEELAGQNVLEYINSMDWNGETTKLLNDAQMKMFRNQQCRGSKGQPNGVSWVVPPLSVDEIYEEPPLNCSSDNLETTTSSGDVITTTTSSVDDLPPTENFTHSAVMDDAMNVKLYWKFDDKYITFEVHGYTTGWVGIGISPNGAMTGADIVVGWVKSGTTYITDRHGTGNTFPPKDPKQNIQLLGGMEMNGWTAIKFRRQLAACEPGYDLPITADTLKIIYAFGKTDPKGDDIEGSDYHQNNRGGKSLILLNDALTDRKDFPEGESHSTFELLNDKFEIPAEETFYNCKLLKFPEFSQKQHVVKIEPVIQPGNKLFVHHILVYYCTDDVTEAENVGEDYRCYGSDMPSNFYSCSSILHAWAVGGGEFHFPSHAGYPLGDADSPKYIMLETHYDNPGRIGGVIDSSGLRFTYTSQLRTHDSGILAVGQWISGLSHIIPPNAESFLTYGECTSDCLSAAMTQGKEENLNVFSVLLHSHTIGVGVKLQHIRNKTELPFIAKDDSYDFNYQETRILSEERVIKSGDSLQVVCNYKSKGVRSGFTVGGLDSSKEMCETFIYYYPKIPTTHCFSGPLVDEITRYFGITETENPGGIFSVYQDLSHVTIVKPWKIAGQSVLDYINSMEWNDQSITKLNNELQTMYKYQQCLGGEGTPSGANWVVPPISIDEIYEEPPLNCSSDNLETTTSSSDVIKTTTSLVKDLPPTENFTHSAVMDDATNVKLYWKFDDKNITFEVHGYTTGWVGIGISPNGAMTGADIVVGWVKSGTTYITDRHGTGNTFPPKDPEQNIQLLGGMEMNGWTVIKFRRQLAACEPGYDLPITADTLRIIYAFGKTDPKGDDIEGSDYHQNNRGGKSLMLLNDALTDRKDFHEGESHSTFELLNDKFEVPAEETFYNCKLLKLPEFSQKQHLVKIEPVIQPGNQLFVHHLIVYYCNDDVTETENVGGDYRCYGSDMPENFYSCNSILHAWAVGGGEFHFPSHAGYPLGDADSPKYIMLETHYDNPGGVEGVIDSSGLRFTHTSQLRTHDTGVLAVGHVVSGLSQIVPPNSESFLTYGECTNNCLSTSMSHGSVNELNVFSVLLHTHLIGVGVKLQHIRKKTELPYIAKDDSYDFNYQETRILSEERVIKLNDSMQVVCNYKTKGVRSGFTVGGFDSSKEMCQAFVYYYPKIPTSICLSGPLLNEITEYFGITETSNPPGFSPYQDLSHVTIVKPEEIAGQSVLDYINSMEWNEQNIKKLNNALQTMYKSQQCIGSEGTPSGAKWVVPPISIDEYYVEPPLNCSSEDFETTTSLDEEFETTTSLDEEFETTTGSSNHMQLHLLMYLLSLILLVNNS